MAAPTTNNEVTARRLTQLLTGSDGNGGLWKKIKDADALKAPLASPSLTGTPTAPTAAAGTNTTQIATTAFVKQAVTDGLATADAMIYKGTIAGGSTGAYGALTAAASKGWTYKVTTAGKIDGVAVEVGDMLICNADSTAAATSSNYSTIVANWDFVQANLDGVVIGPSSVTSGRVATFDGTTGKLIKDSGYTIAKSVPSDAKFTDTTYTFDGTYSSSTNKAATVSTVTNAIGALDVTVSGMGAGKTLTALTETDGKIAATFGNISITKSQITDFPSSMTPTSHSHGNIANGGTLSDTAAAAAGNDYVVIRDADNNKIQTSTIKGTDVADTVSKKHSHSSLTLSTTAQKYDGTNTLALPSSDPYSSARTPTSHASSGTSYGIGTTANYGHVKLVTGDLKNATATDGCAASNAHTHSQYLTSHQTVDSAMSSTSTNPVQNKVVNTALAGKQATLPTSGTVTGTYYVNIAGNAETATHSSTYGYTKLWASGQYSSSKPYALLADKTIGTTGNWGTGWLFKIEMQGEYAIFKINLRGSSSTIQSGTNKVFLIESTGLSTSQLDKLIKATYVYNANSNCVVRIYTDMSCCGTDWQRVTLRQLDNQGGDQNANNIWDPVNFYKNDNNTNMVASVTGTVMTNDYTSSKFWGATSSSTIVDMTSGTYGYPATAYSTGNQPLKIDQNIMIYNSDTENYIRAKVGASSIDMDAVSGKVGLWAKANSNDSATWLCYRDGNGNTFNGNANTATSATKLVDKGDTSKSIYGHFNGANVSSVAPSAGSARTGTQWIVAAYGDTDGGHFNPVDVSNVKVNAAVKADKLATARKTYVTLGTASTSTTRDWSGDTTIPVDGTLGFGNGGTGATSRLGALRALTEENVGTSSEYFLTITTNWAKGGYASKDNVKSVLGLKSAAYTESADYLNAYYATTGKHLFGGTADAYYVNFATYDMKVYHNHPIVFRLMSRYTAPVFVHVLPSGALTGGIRVKAAYASTLRDSGGIRKVGYTYSDIDANTRRYSFWVPQDAWSPIDARLMAVDDSLSGLVWIQENTRSSSEPTGITWVNVVDETNTVNSAAWYGGTNSIRFTRTDGTTFDVAVNYAASAGTASTCQNAANASLAARASVADNMSSTKIEMPEESATTESYFACRIANQHRAVYLDVSGSKRGLWVGANGGGIPSGWLIYADDQGKIWLGSSQTIYTLT